MAKTILVTLVVIAALIAGAWFAFGRLEPSEVKNDDVALEDIKSFEDCEAAGFPIMESHPRQCSVPDGRVYAEELVMQPTYANATADMIVVDLPHPGAVVGKEFVATGRARGTWFFEGSFPIDVVTPTGDILVSTYATAESEWMTTEFVSFKSEMINLPSAYIGPAVLILRKDNPSDLPENDASISIPITVEY